MPLPHDVMFAAGVVSAYSTVLLVAGLWIGFRSGAKVIAAIAASAAITLVIFAVWLHDSVWVARAIPLADVMLWGNLQLPAAALLAGVAGSSLRSPRWQRILLMVSLLTIGVWREMEPLVGSPPPLGPDRWTAGVCRQSTTSSCSAASAATLLSLSGIRTTEAEMARLCLTFTSGTTNLGIYRGLRLKTAGSSLHVVASSPDAADAARWPLPALVNISLRGAGDSWLGGVRHSVVVVGRLPGNRFDVADPFAGRQSWTARQLGGAVAGPSFSLR